MPQEQAVQVPTNAFTYAITKQRRGYNKRNYKVVLHHDSGQAPFTKVVKPVLETMKCYLSFQMFYYICNVSSDC